MKTPRDRILESVTQHKKTRAEIARLAHVDVRTAAKHLGALVGDKLVMAAYEYDETRQPPVGRHVYWK